MNFLQNNFIFIFGAISLIGIVFAASGLTKSNAFPAAPEAGNAAETAQKIDPPEKTPKVAADAKARPHYQISGLKGDDDVFGQERL